MKFDISKGFPLLTSKKVFMKAIIHELLWFIAGDTNIKYLVDNDVKIWNEWAYERYKNKTDEKENLTFNEFIEEIKSLDQNSNFVKEFGSRPYLWISIEKL